MVPVLGWSFAFFFFAAMILSDGFRRRLNEIWSVYVLNFLPTALPYAILWVFYDLVNNGALAKMLQGAFHAQP